MQERKDKTENRGKIAEKGDRKKLKYTGMCMSFFCIPQQASTLYSQTGSVLTYCECEVE